jgi:hypothetical protein
MNSGASYASNPLVIQDSSSETYGVPSVKFEIQGMDDANCNWIMDFLIIDLARAFGKHAYTIFRNAWRDQYSVVLKVQQTGHPIQNATITIAPELNIEGGTEVLVTDSNGYAGTAEPSMHREGRYSVVSCDTSTFGGPFSVQQSNFEFRSVTVLPIELTVVMPLTEGNVTVFDDTTNMELDGATVSIVGYNGSTPWGSGVYHFSDVPWGDRYYLTATCPGYQDYTSSSPVTFASYGAVSLPDIRMIPL